MQSIRLEQEKFSSRAEDSHINRKRPIGARSGWSGSARVVERTNEALVVYQNRLNTRVESYQNMIRFL